MYSNVITGLKSSDTRGTSIAFKSSHAFDTRKCQMTYDGSKTSPFTWGNMKYNDGVVRETVKTRLLRQTVSNCNTTLFTFNTTQIH